MEQYKVIKLKAFRVEGVYGVCSKVEYQMGANLVLVGQSLKNLLSDISVKYIKWIIMMMIMIMMIIIIIKKSEDVLRFQLKL